MCVAIILAAFLMLRYRDRMPHEAFSKGCAAQPLGKQTDACRQLL